MPVSTKPKAGDSNNRVFVYSMADLFGDWEPQEWIDRVMEVCAENTQWTYLFLTKNPTRLPTIKLPNSSWIGSTIDIQARVNAVAEAFEKMKMKNLFVSCEPLLEKVMLGGKLLRRIKLVIIGSKSLGAVKAQPDSAWVESLFIRARKAGMAVWFKDNLNMECRPQEFPEPV